MTSIDSGSQPILSIVIPTWNREIEVIRALDSVLPLLNCHRRVELIVTDNASTDHTLRSVNNWLSLNKIDAIVLQSDSNIGPVRNWIKGISSASGHYVSLLFSDDLLAFNGKDEPQLFVDELAKVSKDGVRLIRLPVQIVDDMLRLSSDNSIELAYPYAMNRGQFLTLTTPTAFLLNHLLPRSIRLANTARSFSPVSPAGYIIEKGSILATLRHYCNRHTYKQNGAGIDQLAILCAARDSSKVAFVRSPTSVMVASPSSITHNSMNSSRASHNLAISYYTSQLHFSIDSLLKTISLSSLLFLAFSMLRLSKQRILLAISK